MPFILLAFVLLLPLAFVLLLPFSVLQRYRAGTARRVGRPWVAKINFLVIGFSAMLFIFAAAITNIWVPHALLYSAMGLIGGSVLGLLGLKLTRWEPTAGALHYTPNRPLVLLITVAVTARIIYGFWRAWQAWENAGNGSWLAASGAAGSLAMGAVVLGYYFTYWVGVGRRVRRHRHQNKFYSETLKR